MATEKILIFDEAGNAKRMKVRIARFLDNEPVTASDKENIRTTLNVDGSQSGTFTTPLSVTSASDSSFSGGGNVTVSGGVTTLNNSGDNALRVESTNGNPMYVNVVGAAQNYLFDVRDDGTSKFRVDGSGRVGIGTASIANKLTVEPADNDGILIDSNNDGRTGYLYFGDASSKTVGAVSYDHYSDSLRFNTAGSQRWTINSTGNLVANSGLGISFSATSDGSGSMSSEVLSDYEEGTWSPVFGVTSGSLLAAMDVISARYVKVGHLVNFYCYIRTNNVNITGAGGQLIVSGLPYANAGSNNFPACSVGYTEGWVNSPSAGYVVSGGSFIYLTKRVTGITGNLSEMTASDMTTGAVATENQVMLSGTYYSF